MEKIFYNSYDTDEMGLTYEDYKESCEINEREPKAEDSNDFYQWINDELEFEWEDLMYEVKHYDSKNPAHYYAEADFGFWNGRVQSTAVFSSLEKAIYGCVGDVDYIIINTNDDGTISMTGIHHDGRNYFTIKRMTDEAFERYDDLKYNGDEESFELKDNEVVSLVA